MFNMPEVGEKGCNKSNIIVVDDLKERNLVHTQLKN